ncbi:unnamed protein product [Urochloa decumbens]|uniref:Uncharacterized protein n=1 Tax=Urochloa decumbens TaxID=240449 RepID=A0ABC9E2A6_9POAL
MQQPPPPAAVADDDPDCTFARCICRWLRYCSPRIPPVGPGRDYDRVPLGADGRAAWLLILGFRPPSSAGTASPQRLRRLRVARSGRVLGRSDDALEILDGADYDAIRGGKSAQISADDGGGRITSSRTLPPLPPRPFMKPIRPISAAGDLWAPGFLNPIGPTSLVMLRLDKESERWVQVAAMDVTHCVIHGYAVVHDSILLSLEPRHLFVVFNCTTCAWAAVKTQKDRATVEWRFGEFVCDDYIPIRGRGLYVEEDDAIYVLSKSMVYAYKLCRDQNDDDQCRYRMALPTIIDCVCPFREGSGFLRHLGGRVMCFVWISVPLYDSHLHCNRGTPHVLITTFRVVGDSGSSHEQFIPKGVQVLHSTCRRLDDIDQSKPSASDYMFCFLQEYEENAPPPTKQKREKPSTSLELVEVPASSNVVESSKMLPCCRRVFSETNLVCALRLENSVIQTTKDLYIVCQTHRYSTVFKINIMDGKLACHNQNLTPYSVMDTFVCADLDDLMDQPFPWHFICDSTSIYAVPGKMNDVHVLSLAMGTLSSFEATRPAGIDFSVALVVLVGLKIIAVSDTLGGVYHLSDTHEWKHCSIQGSVVDLEKKVKLSGYVVLSNESFMVCDGAISRCFLFDLDKVTWSIVRACSELSTVPPTGWCARGFLTGRSVFVEGFIYTCSEKGLEAYEFLKLQDSYYVGQRISLNFSWRKYLDSDRMCLDYVGQDTTSGAVLFCVVQGNNYHPLPGAPPKHPVLITTVQVKTERTPRNTLKPVAIGHVNACTSFVEQDGGPIWTRGCFAP